MGGDKKNWKRENQLDFKNKLRIFIQISNLPLSFIRPLYYIYSSKYDRSYATVFQAATVQFHSCTDQSTLPYSSSGLIQRTTRSTCEARFRDVLSAHGEAARRPTLATDGTLSARLSVNRWPQLDQTQWVEFAPSQTSIALQHFLVFENLSLLPSFLWNFKLI